MVGGRTAARQAIVCGLALTLALMLTACSGAGPSKRDLLSAASEADASFALVDVSDGSLDMVSGWSRPSFSAVFGDYRAPKIKRIDVGDSVQINIWEAGSGGIFSVSTASDRFTSGTRASTIPDQVVARDGTINVPYAGRIRVAGKSPQEVEEQIVNKLQGKAAEPQALVSLTRNISNSATVTVD